MPGQIDVIEARQRFLTCMGGRGYGKTFFLSERIVDLCFRYPGFKYRMLTPLIRQGNLIFRNIISCGRYDKYIDKVWNRPYPQIRFKNPTGQKLKSEALWLSLERPENLRGEEADEACIDESQSDKITSDVVQSIIMPWLSRRIALHGNGLQRGTLLMTGQFRGEDFRYTDYWLKGLPFEFARDSEGVPLFHNGMHVFDRTKPNPDYDPNYKSWAFPSGEGWSYKIQPGGKAELEAMRKITRKATYEQEYLCLPRANANAAFDPSHINQCIRGVIELVRRQGINYICGIDPGKKTDPTKLVVMDHTGQVVFAEEYKLGQDHAISARMAATTASRYGAACVVDVTGGIEGGHGKKNEAVDFYRAEIQNRGLAFHPFYWNDTNKNRIIENLEFALQNRKVGIPADLKDVIAELRKYEYVYAEKTKRYFYGAPRGQHDDYVAALATAYDGLITGKLPPLDAYRGMY